MVPAVIPCAVQREAVLCRHGILQHAGARKDPVSAQRHYAPQRARDDSREPFNRMRYKTPDKREALSTGTNYSSGPGLILAPCPSCCKAAFSKRGDTLHVYNFRD